MGIFIMKEIKLSKQGKNKGKYVALVDDEDFERINQFRWHATKMGNNIYACRSCWIEGKKRTLMMHSYILNIEHSAINGIEVDHWNHIGLDNQKHNLRICTKIQNAQNKLKRDNCSSKFKGVYKSSECNRFISRIVLNRKTIIIGRFKDETEAAKAYDKKAKELFGEFAHLNF